MDNSIEEKKIAARRVRNAYGMLKQALLDDIVEHDNGDGDLVLNRDTVREVTDDLWYTLEVFRHDILPAFGIKVDEKGKITNDDDI